MPQIFRRNYRRDIFKITVIVTKGYTMFVITKDFEKIYKHELYISSIKLDKNTIILKSCHAIDSKNNYNFSWALVLYKDQTITLEYQFTIPEEFLLKIKEPEATQIKLLYDI